MKTQDSEILRRSSVFRFLPDEHFGAIEPLLQEEHYDFGDVIVKQDDQADSFYVLTRGRARALKIKPDGEEIPLGVLKPGDSFGEAARARLYRSQWPRPESRVLPRRRFFWRTVNLERLAARGVGGSIYRLPVART